MLHLLPSQSSCRLTELHSRRLIWALPWASCLNIWLMSAKGVEIRAVHWNTNTEVRIVVTVEYKVSESTCERALSCGSTQHLCWPSWKHVWERPAMRFWWVWSQEAEVVVCVSSPRNWFSYLHWTTSFLWDERSEVHVRYSRSKDAITVLLTPYLDLILRCDLYVISHNTACYAWKMKKINTCGLSSSLCNTVMAGGGSQSLRETYLTITAGNV